MSRVTNEYRTVAIGPAPVAFAGTVDPEGGVIEVTVSESTVGVPAAWVTSTSWPATNIVPMRLRMVVFGCSEKITAPFAAVMISIKDALLVAVQVHVGPLVTVMRWAAVLSAAKAKLKGATVKVQAEGVGAVGVVLAPLQVEMSTDVVTKSANLRIGLDTGAL